MCFCLLVCLLASFLALFSAAPLSPFLFSVSPSVCLCLFMSPKSDRQSALVWSGRQTGMGDAEDVHTGCPDSAIQQAHSDSHRGTPVLPVRVSVFQSVWVSCHLHNTSPSPAASPADKPATSANSASQQWLLLRRAGECLYRLPLLFSCLLLVCLATLLVRFCQQTLKLCVSAFVFPKS